MAEDVMFLMLLKLGIGGVEAGHERPKVIEVAVEVGDRCRWWRRRSLKVAGEIWTGHMTGHVDD